MFVFRPHVHGREGVTTPELIVDRVWRADESGRSVSGPLPSGAQLLLSVASLEASEAKLVPAYVLVGAQYGTLVALGFELRTGMQPESSQFLPRVLGRMAWRVDDVVGHLGRLSLRLTRSSGGQEQQFGRELDPPIGIESELAQAVGEKIRIPRGCAIFCLEDRFTCAVANAHWCEVELHDPVLQRSLRHRLSFSQGN